MGRETKILYDRGWGFTEYDLMSLSMNFELLFMN
jgi:hypothetical protein